MRDSLPTGKIGKGFVRSKLIEPLERVPDRNITVMLLVALLLGIIAFIDAARAGDRLSPPPETVPDSPAPHDGHGFASNGGKTSNASRLYLFGGDFSGGSATGLLDPLWYYRSDAIDK